MEVQGGQAGSSPWGCHGNGVPAPPRSASSPFLPGLEADPMDLAGEGQGRRERRSQTLSTDSLAALGGAGSSVSVPPPPPSSPPPMGGEIIPNGPFRAGKNADGGALLWASLPRERCPDPSPPARATNGDKRSGRMGQLSTEGGARGSLPGNLGRKRGGSEEGGGRPAPPPRSLPSQAGVGTGRGPHRMPPIQVHTDPGSSPPEPGDASAMQNAGSTQTRRIRSSGDGGGEDSGCYTPRSDHC